MKYQKFTERLIPIVEAVKKQTNSDIKNITQSMGFAVRQPDGKLTFQPIADYYQKTLDKAVLDITSGSFDYNTVLKRTVQEMTDSGLRWIDYASGHHNRVPVAVRRAVMTGVNQVTAKIAEQNMELLQTEYVEVSWHRGARPSHQVWQGKIYHWKEKAISRQTKTTPPKNSHVNQENNLTLNNVNGINNNIPNENTKISGDDKPIEFKRIIGEHSSKEDILNTNPNYYLIGGFYCQNCQRCVIAYELRRRGYDVIAKPKAGSKDYFANMVKDNEGWFTVFESYEKVDCGADKGEKVKENIEKQMKAWYNKDKTNIRAAINVCWETEGSHVFIVEYDGSKIEFLEPQCSYDAVKHFDNIFPWTADLIRLDNVKFTDKIVNFCENSIY